MKNGQALLQFILPIAGADAAARLAINKLRELAGDCPQCGGVGGVGEDFEVFLLTDDPRSLNARARRRAVRIEAPRVESYPRARLTLQKTCHGCADIRHVVKLCEAAL